MLSEEGDVARLSRPDLGDFRLLADRLQTERGVGQGRCKQSDVMTVQPQLATEQMGMHLQPAGEGFCDRIFEMCDDADAHPYRRDRQPDPPRIGPWRKA